MISIYTNAANKANYVMVKSDGDFIVVGEKVHSTPLMAMIDFECVDGWVKS